MSDRVQITVFDNGPMKVSNVGSLTYCGDRLEADGDVFLCRCGDSSNAPFCDGTHSKQGFVGQSESPPDEDVRVWEGRTLRTRFNTKTCMHVLYCKPLSALRARELVGDDAAGEEIIRVVQSCPSGALAYEVKDAEACTVPQTAAPQTAIQIIEGGEIRLLAPFDINADRHAHQPEDRATLCRCGLSENKPWCDGRHRRRKDFR